MHMLKKTNCGQSLVEVVVAFGVVILMVTGLIIGTTYSLKANQNSRARSIATKLVQQGLEFARKDRESSWYAFKDLTSTSATFCVGNVTSYTTPKLVPLDPFANPFVTCSGNKAQTNPTINFTRFATFTWYDMGDPLPPSNNPSPTDLMRVTVKVRWNEGTVVRTSQATSDFTKWR
jgi:Tfp pilus assembly protein PilV